MQQNNITTNSLTMFKLFFLLILFLGVTACSKVNKSEVVIPEKLLSKTQMVEILTQIQIAEAGFSINKNKLEANTLKPQSYNKILEQYSISTKQFKENINYYYDSPVVMEDIYEQVLGKLSKIQSDVIIEKEKLDNQIVADSIAAILADSIKQVNEIN